MKNLKIDFLAGDPVKLEIELFFSWWEDGEEPHHQNELLKVSQSEYDFLMSNYMDKCSNDEFIQALLHKAKDKVNGALFNFVVDYPQLFLKYNIDDIMAIVDAEDKEDEAAFLDVAKRYNNWKKDRPFYLNKI